MAKTRKVKTQKQNTIKSMAKKVANNGDQNDYVTVPFGVDSENIDRPDGSTGEETFIKLLNGENLGVALKYEDPYLYLLDGNGVTLSQVMIVSTIHNHSYTETITKEATYTEAGLKTCTCACGDSYTEEIPMLTDSTNPSGVIKIGENSYSTLSTNVSFDTYFNSAQNVVIEASDDGSGVKETAYSLANAAVNEADLPSLTWTAYNGPFTISPNNNYIVYARITDNTDNITYINTNGIVLDNIAPVFNGLEDGGSYPEGTVLTVEDGETLTVNGVAVDLVNNTYTFNTMDNYLLSLTDRAGNTASISIEIIENNPYGIAPENELDDWEYELDEANNAVVLKHYTRKETDTVDVIVYDKYRIGDKLYNTKLVGGELFGYQFSAPFNCTINSVVFGDNVDTSGLTNMDYMFRSNIKSIKFGKNFNTSNVTSMNETFRIDASSLDLSMFDTSKVTNMSLMFYNCKNLTEINGLENFNTSKVTNMYKMFESCFKLQNINLSNFNTSNVTNMNYMFYDCKSLTSLDVSSFNTSNVTNMDYMFFGCQSLTSLNVSSFNTSNVTNMSKMFSMLKKITEINGLTSFNTYKVTTTEGMFASCPLLMSLDLTSFDISSLTNMNLMFQACDKLAQIKVSRNKWIIPDGCSSYNVFRYCGCDDVTYVD